MSRTLQIEIVSDFVCPWCYIGKKRVEKALEAAPEVNADIVWRPFQLSPDMPREGRNRLEHYRDIFGAERAEQIMSNMRDTGTEEGIAFGASPDAMSPNTLSAHTLLLWAEESPDIDADALAEALFSAHHVDCADLGDHNVLAAIAATVGMDADEVTARLAAAADEDRVQAAIQESQARGVSGVPFFIIDGKYGVSGAQPPEMLADAFRRIAAESGQAGSDSAA